jgi:hypothetical protein
MGMLAFIINVGLFVKAKINLQNSVDAAAFAGASVQARQLTNIAYLNWEMRNNYKEWLFKYYVLGELSSLRPTTSGGTSGDFPLYKSLRSGGPANFTLRTLNSVSASVAGQNLNIGTMAGYNGAPAYDRYNVPSICIHNGVNNDICPSYVVPGLPRFQAIGVAGISEIHETAVDELVRRKGQNCSQRSKDNFEAALLWAYGDGTPLPGLHYPPLLTAERPGAWMRAVDISMRMRNLEMVVNSPPIKTAIMKNNIDEITESTNGDSNIIGLHERTYKAFWSAYKNLGGGFYKSDAGGQKDELANNFKLYELAPKPFQANETNLSGYFITKNHQAMTKYYLDLQPIVLNLATMYSTFTSTTSKLTSDVESQGTCGISKTALPVPGFILGFQKNPKVMTYYAVRGESKFIGLFYPFSNPEGVTLTAYAAAKPFGGRIGPRLFKFDNNQTVVVRGGDPSQRSLSHLYGLDVGLDDPNKFNPGDPIPVDKQFWVHASAGGSPVLGGVPASDASNKPYFGIPNMVYDYINIGSQTGSSGVGGAVVDIKRRVLSTDDFKENLGLYNIDQYTALKSSLSPTGSGNNVFLSGSGGNFDQFDVINAIVKARRATRYDLANYLVPDYKPPGLQSEYPYVVPMGQPADKTPHKQDYRIFAPLYKNSRLIFKTQAEVEEAMKLYINSMADAVKQYLHGLYVVAKAIHDAPPVSSGGTVGSTTLNDQAAITIHANGANGRGDIPPALIEGSCAEDIASKFSYFFNSSNQHETKCKVKPLISMVLGYVNNIKDPDNWMHLYTDYYIGNTDAVSQGDLFSAYSPGPRQGTVGDMIGSPIDTSNSTPPYSAKRNFYSTKFVRLAYLTDIGDPSSGKVNETPLREDVSKQPDELQGEIPDNLLQIDAATGFDGSEFYKRF